jgi:hypothetical protein
MANKENAAKLDAIVSRFTNDPTIKANVMQHMKEFQAGTTSVGEIIAQYTTDPELTAKIRQRIAEVQAGKHMASVTAFGADDANHAAGASETASEHVGAIDHIVKS